jgi:PPOX class probable F420-dependent enzyme
MSLTEQPGGPAPHDLIIDQVPATHLDLLHSPLPFVLTTVDTSCRPQSSVIWAFVDRDGLLKGTTLANRQKYRNLRHNAACTLVVIDPNDDHRTVEIRADAELVPDPDRTTVRAIAPKYGADPERLGRAPGDRVTMVFRPVKVVTMG